MKICWIHIGMHKTGSTAIQEYLSRARRGPGWRYVRVDGRPNMNRALHAMFDSQPHRHPVFVKEGLSPEQVAKMRSVYRERLIRVLGRMDKGLFILSAEMASLIDAAGVAEMRKFLSPLCDEIRIIGYVRPPVGFKNSLFQEQVKHGKGTLKTMTAPRYRMRFEKFDKVFGPDKVLLGKFDPSLFPGGCIVADFCRKIGIDPPSPGSVARTNESLGREACGILYAYRKYGPGYGVGPNVVRENSRLIAPLLEMGGTKFRFSKSLLEKISGNDADDRAWMERRLGDDLTEKVAEDGNEVGSEEDLLRIPRWACEEYALRFHTIYKTKVPAEVIPTGDPADPVAVAAMIENCREVIRSQIKAKRMKKWKTIRWAGFLKPALRLLNRNWRKKHESSNRLPIRNSGLSLDSKTTTDSGASP